jgi:ATP-dependent DNA helicase DinG
VDAAGDAVGLADRTEAVFADGGLLAQAHARHQWREPQVRMARAVASALARRQDLVVEAGTGVGKTFAYLVPLLLAGQRALVCTATKTLQDQLYLRDLPQLKAALGVPARLALLKGRASYLCLHRLARARLDAGLSERSVAMLARIESWALATRSGDLGEVPGLDEQSPVIPLVSSTRDNCLGATCGDFSRCHVVKARREAMAADIVVANHHLFFADLVLRDTGMAELLPSVDAVVFDEAHQLVDVGLQFLGLSLSTSQGVDLARDVLAVGLRCARGFAEWPALASGLERAARELRLAVGPGSARADGARRVPWEVADADSALAHAIAAMTMALEAAADAVEALQGLDPDLDKIGSRGRELAERCARFAKPVPLDHIRWIDIGLHGVRLVESPLDVREALLAQRESATCTWVFTSATLGDDDRLSWFTGRAGAEDADVLRVGSPFDHARQARLWVPSSIRLPQHPDHALDVGQVAARCARVLDGRTFVLTTTLRALPRVAQALADSLHADGGPPIEVLVQGSEPRRALLARFGDGQGRVLVGSHSFWEGVDVPGDALQCVLIDKLPFPPPNDPLMQARSRRIEQQGGRPFEALHLVETAVALKQGAGRLIRTPTDRGLLVVCDPRLSRMGYGRRLLAALPPMTRVDTEGAALDWLRSLRD